MAQDFLGSIAQEDVQFITQILTTTTPGDNYWKLMMFIEDTRFVEDATAFVQIPGTTLMVASVTVDTYTTAVKGLARSWLYDFFVSGTASSAYIVIAGADISGDASDFNAGMAAAYAKLKAYAYWKTVCAGSDTALLPDCAVALAALCTPDINLLSAPPLYPYTTLTPEDPTSDPIYDAFQQAGGGGDCILTAHQDDTRNGSLFRLGQALAFLNSSGTVVGNNFDYIATALITASGEVGSNLNATVRGFLKDLNIAFFKPVGDSSGNVAAVGVKTLRGNNIQAYWIVNYIQYMSKTAVATYITQPNRLRNAATYAVILSILRRFLNSFGAAGSQRLANMLITAPSFENLPPAKGDEIVIPNAWSATYTDQVHQVRVYGSLTIAA